MNFPSVELLNTLKVRGFCQSSSGHPKIRYSVVVELNVPRIAAAVLVQKSDSGDAGVEGIAVPAMW